MADQTMKNPEESVDIRNTNEKYSFEQKEFKVQKVFWVLIVILLAAGLLGAFGEGAMSNTKLEEDEFYIEYDRFLRDETPAAFFVFIKKNTGDKAIVSVGKEYMEKVKIEGIVPQPESAEAKDNELIYVFNAANSGLITFNINPQYVGTVNLEITVQGKTTHLNQFVFF